MEGSSKDVASLLTGTGIFGISLRKSLRNRLGERYLFPVAPGLFAVPFFINHFLKQLLRSFRIIVPLLSARQRIILSASLILICLAGKVDAVPVYRQYHSTPQYGFQSGGAHYQWWTYSSLDEADNIEGIYNRLENQYSLLERTYYPMAGNDYLLRDVGYPGGLGLRYYYRLKYPGGNIFFVTNVTAYTSSIYVKPRGPFDAVKRTVPFGGFGPEYPPVRLREIPIWVVPGCCKNMETEAVPELSSFMLLGSAALQILILRRIAGD